jgi:RimJ/RimL family protein N-acetyltransferase
MATMPVLWTERLKLRPFTLSDGPIVRHLAGDRAVATATRGIPYPYPRGLAEQWIASHQLMYDQSLATTLAIVERSSGRIVGAVRLAIDDDTQTGRLGFWVGKPYWNQGFATEALQAVVTYALKTRQLHAVFAAHAVGNDAAARVLEKLGLQREPALPRAARAWGRYDAEVYYSRSLAPQPQARHLAAVGACA